MTTVFRIAIVTPFAIIAFAAFAAALLIEWLGDLARTCPDSEKTS
ncbi:MAG: hypothetical protein ABI769_11860 [Pseudomonadota bacterium]